VIEAAKVFESIRKVSRKGIATSQVAPIDAIIKVMNDSNVNDREAAYILATTYHETAYTMRPISEFGSDDRFKALYDIEGKNPKLAKRLGNIHPGDGIKYKGRGFVQITGRNNYAEMGRMFGVDLINDPEKALEPELAAKILVKGMLLGSFTGISLKSYGPYKDNLKYFIDSRRIVNGTDKAYDIAAYAVTIYEVL